MNGSTIFPLFLFLNRILFYTNNFLLCLSDKANNFCNRIYVGAQKYPKGNTMVKCFKRRYTGPTQEYIIDLKNTSWKNQEITTPSLRVQVQLSPWYFYSTLQAKWIVIHCAPKPNSVIITITEKTSQLPAGGVGTILDKERGSTSVFSGCSKHSTGD